MRNRVLVLGRGKMGRAIAFAMDKLDNDVYTFDKEITPRVSSYIGEVGGKVYKNALDELKPNVVISALPYWANKRAAFPCIERKIPYCDLGGHIGTSKEINEYSKEKGGVVFTDLGLAPGLVNILGELASIYCKNCHTVKMYCGGIPSCAYTNYLGYQPTWSADGLYNEYTDECETLEWGEIKRRDALDGYEYVEHDAVGKIEAFNTSGAASHSIQALSECGVKNVSYKTMRWYGHRDKIKFLLEALSKEEFCKVISNLKSSHRDIVVIKVVAKGKTNGFENAITKDILIEGLDGFTAMQTATAYPAAAAAQCLAGCGKGLTNSVDYNYLTMNQLFWHTLKTLGININE